MKKKNLWLRLVSLAVLGAFTAQEAALAAEFKPTQIPFFDRPALTLELPRSVAIVGDSHRGQGKTLILIQDAHTNESAQLNISKVLETILTEHRIRLVFLEAADGNNSLAVVRDKAPLEKRQQVAREYLRKGVLDGSEYLDITSGIDFLPWGVEDKALYWEALKNYEKVAKGREKFQAYLRQAEVALQTLKPRIFGPSLMAFDEKRRAFLKEEMPLTDYLDVLMKESGKRNAAITHYPHLLALAALKEKEKAIDFDKANAEQAKAVSLLSEEDRALLKESASREQASSPFKLSGTDHKTQKAFYALLEEAMARSAATTRAEFPELSQYCDYLKDAESIDPKAILEEKTLLENEIYASLIRTADEHDMRRADDALRFLRSLFDLTVTPDEFDAYKADHDSFDIVSLTGFLNRKIMDLKNHYERVTFLEEGYGDYVKAAEEFYRLTYERDVEFLDRAITMMDKTGDEKAVLIAGGYHTPNLSALLRDKGLSYIVVMPQVLAETNRKKYESLLLSQNAEDLGLGSVQADKIAVFHSMGRKLLALAAFGLTPEDLKQYRDRTFPVRKAAAPKVEAPGGGYLPRTGTYGSRLAEIDIRQIAQDLSLVPDEITDLTRDPESFLNSYVQRSGQNVATLRREGRGDAGIDASEVLLENARGWLRRISGTRLAEAPKRFTIELDNGRTLYFVYVVLGEAQRQYHYNVFDSDAAMERNPDVQRSLGRVMLATDEQGRINAYHGDASSSLIFGGRGLADGALNSKIAQFFGQHMGQSLEVLGARLAATYRYSDNSPEPIKDQRVTDTLAKAHPGGIQQLQVIHEDPGFGNHHYIYFYALGKDGKVSVTLQSTIGNDYGYSTGQYRVAGGIDPDLTGRLNGKSGISLQSIQILFNRGKAYLSGVRKDGTKTALVPIRSGARLAVTADQGAHDFWRRVESGNSVLLNTDGENGAINGALGKEGELTAELNGKLLIPRPRKSETPEWDSRVSVSVADGTARTIKAALGDEQREAALANLKKQSKNNNLQSWDLVAVGESIALVGWENAEGAIGQAPNVVMIDTINTPFNGLSDGWKGKNADAVRWASKHEGLISSYEKAELVAVLGRAVEAAFTDRTSLVESLGSQGSIGQALLQFATVIHDEWMANNQKEDWNSALFVPFAQLPTLEQLKDINGLIGNLRARSAGSRLAVAADFAQMSEVDAELEKVLGQERYGRFFQDFVSAQQYSPVAEALDKWKTRDSVFRAWAWREREQALEVGMPLDSYLQAFEVPEALKASRMQDAILKMDTLIKAVELMLFKAETNTDKSDILNRLNNVRTLLGEGNIKQAYDEMARISGDISEKTIVLSDPYLGPIAYDFAPHYKVIDELRAIQEPLKWIAGARLAEEGQKIDLAEAEGSRAKGNQNALSPSPSAPSRGDEVTALGARMAVGRSLDAGLIITKRASDIKRSPVGPDHDAIVALFEQRDILGLLALANDERQIPRTRVEALKKAGTLANRSDIKQQAAIKGNEIIPALRNLVYGPDKRLQYQATSILEKKFGLSGSRLALERSVEYGGTPELGTRLASTSRRDFLRAAGSAAVVAAAAVLGRSALLESAAPEAGRLRTVSTEKLLQGAAESLNISIAELEDALKQFAVKLWMTRTSQAVGRNFSMRVSAQLNAILRIEETGSRSDPQITLSLQTKEGEFQKLTTVDDPRGEFDRIAKQQEASDESGVSPSDTLAANAAVLMAVQAINAPNASVLTLFEIDAKSVLGAIQDKALFESQLESSIAGLKAAQNFNRNLSGALVNVSELAVWQQEIAREIATKHGVLTDVKDFKGVIVQVFDPEARTREDLIRPDNGIQMPVQPGKDSFNGWAAFFTLGDKVVGGVIQTSTAYDAESNVIDATRVTPGSVPEEIQSYIERNVESAVEKTDLTSVWLGRADWSLVLRLAFKLPLVKPMVDILIQANNLITKAVGMAA